MEAEFKWMDFLLGFVLPNVALIVGGATIFTLARGWPWRGQTTVTTSKRTREGRCGVVRR